MPTTITGSLSINCHRNRRSVHQPGKRRLRRARRFQKKFFQNILLRNNGKRRFGASTHTKRTNHAKLACGFIYNMGDSQELLSKNILLHLSHGIAREFCNKVHTLRNLVVRKLYFHLRNDILL